MATRAEGRRIQTWRQLSAPCTICMVSQLVRNCRPIPLGEHEYPTVMKFRTIHYPFYDVDQRVFISKEETKWKSKQEANKLLCCSQFLPTWANETEIFYPLQNASGRKHPMGLDRSKRWMHTEYPTSTSAEHGNAFFSPNATEFFTVFNVGQ